MKLSTILFSIFGLAAVQALPTQVAVKLGEGVEVPAFQVPNQIVNKGEGDGVPTFQIASRQEEGEGEAASEEAAPEDAQAAGTEVEKYHHDKPDIHPHPVNWHAIYAAVKALAPVVGGLIEPLLVNIVEGVVGAVIHTINTGFSIPHHHDKSAEALLGQLQPAQ